MPSPIGQTFDSRGPLLPASPVAPVHSPSTYPARLHSLIPVALWLKFCFLVLKGHTPRVRCLLLTVETLTERQGLPLSFTRSLKACLIAYVSKSCHKRSICTRISILSLLLTFGLQDFDQSPLLEGKSFQGVMVSPPCDPPLPSRKPKAFDSVSSSLNSLAFV